MKELMPEAVIVSLEDGCVMISACFECPRGVKPETFVNDAVRSTSQSLNQYNPFEYFVEVIDANTFIFKKRL